MTLLFTKKKLTAEDYKSLSLEEKNQGRLIRMAVVGKMEKEDYEAFVPEIDYHIKQHGSIRLLLILEDFKGWTAGALWEECKLAYHHLGSDVERIAVVGNKEWEKGMAGFIKPFTKTEVKYFDETEIDGAESWVSDGL